MTLKKRKCRYRILLANRHFFLKLHQPDCFLQIDIIVRNVHIVYIFVNSISDLSFLRKIYCSYFHFLTIRGETSCCCTGIVHSVEGFETKKIDYLLYKLLFAEKLYVVYSSVNVEKSK